MNRQLLPAIMLLFGPLLDVFPVILVPDQPGLEFTIRENRMHCTMAANRMHCTIPENWMHWTVPEED